MVLKLSEAEKRRRELVKQKEKERRDLEASSQKERQEAAGNTGVLIGGRAATQEDIERINIKATAPAESQARIDAVREQRRKEQLLDPRLTSVQEEKALQRAQELVNVLPGQEPLTETLQEPVTEDVTTTLPPGITQEDVEAFGSLEAAQAAAGGIIPVEPFDLVGGFGKGVLASLASIGTRGLAKAGAKEAPSLIKEGQGVLKSPVAIRKITKGLKERLQAGAALGGAVLTGAALKAFTGADIAAIEQEVTKYGEILAGIPQAAKSGLFIEDEKIVEYTIEDAFVDIDDVITTLETYQDELQRQGIGNAILRLTGRYDGAQIEIDKQLEKASSIQGDIIQEQINPSQSRLDAQDIFRLIELEGLVKE